MHRRAFATVAAAVLLVAAACTGGGDATRSGDGPVEGAIRVQVSGGESEVAAFAELADSFEQAHPGTTVQIVAFAQQGEHIAKLAASFAGRNPPDVFLLNYRRVGQFVASGVVEPMGDHLGGLAARDFFEPAIRAFTFGGTLACLPQNASSVVIYYNPALFARAGVAAPKAGWTFEDLVETARTLFTGGVKDAIGFEPSLRTLAPFVWSAGAEIVDDLAAPTRITLDTDAGRRALKLLNPLQDTGVDATERAAADAEERFGRGEVAMLIESRRAVPGLRKTGVDFDVVSLPVDKEPATLLASDGYCVAKAGKNQPLAQEFVRYAVGPDGGKVLAATGRTVPSLKSLATGPVFLDPAKPPKSSQVWLDALPSARALPSVAAWNEAEETASAIIEQLLGRKITIDDAIERIEKDTARVFAQKR